MLWFAYVVACSLYAKGFGSYFLEFFDRYIPVVTHLLVGTFGHNISVALLTITIGILFLAVNIIGAHASGKTENIITLAKIAILSVFIFFGVKQVLSAPEITRENFTPLFPNGFGGVLGAMGLTFIAFEGYDLIATVSEEVKNPRKTIPRAIMYSLAITIVIYLLVVFVCLGAVPASGGVPTWQALGNYGELGIVQAAQSFMPKFGVVLILGGGLFATLSALNATILACSRVAFSMGRDWMLPNALSRIHSVRRTPVVAITVSGLLFLVIAVFMPLATIGTASSLLFLLTFAMVNVALMMYRSRSVDTKDRFLVPLYPLTPVLGVATCAGLAIYQLANETTAGVLAGGWVLAGFGIYLVFFSKRARIADVPRTIESPELLTLRRTGRYRVLVPLSNPANVESLLEMAGRIARASQGDILGLTIVNLPDVTAYAEAEPFMRQAQKVLEKAQEVSFNRELPFSSLLKIGRDPGDEIRNVARDNHCNLVLMGYMAEGDPLENSIIHRLSTHQTCDLVVMRGTPEGSPSFKRILVPIGGRIVHTGLKVRIVHSLQRNHDCRVTLMTVVPSGATSLQKQRAQDNLNRAASLYQAADVEKVLDESDDVAESVINRAEDHDLLILGMRVEPWLRSFFFGTVNQGIMAQVRCPTILVKAFAPERSRVKRLLGRSLPPG
jgi:amino acid transporter/nucleotide-binding universal stress UspA family protein